MSNSPKSLLGRDLLKHLEAAITFKEGEMELRIKDKQLIEILSLTLIQHKSKKEDLPEIEEIFNQVYPGIWASEVPRKAKNALPVKIEIKRGAHPVQIKQYLLRLEDRKGIK